MAKTDLIDKDWNNIKAGLDQYITSLRRQKEQGQKTKLLRDTYDQIIKDVESTIAKLA